MVDKKALSERDICTKYITPAIERAGWDTITQMREEVSFTDGRIMHRMDDQEAATFFILASLYLANRAAKLQEWR